MDGNKRRRAVRNAGAFLAPDGTFGVPMRTLSDEYEDLPVVPEDDQVPEPEPPGLVRRMVDRLIRRLGRIVGAVFVVLLVGLVGCGSAAPPGDVLGYSTFLDDVAIGRVSSVVQSDQYLTVYEGTDVYSVVAPSVTTDVFGDMQRAAAGSGRTLHRDIYSAIAPPDNSWVGLLLTGLLPLLVIGGFLLFAMRAARRMPRPDSLAGRMAQLEDARKAGQVTAEEYEAKRAEIIKGL